MYNVLCDALRRKSIQKIYPFMQKIIFFFVVRYFRFTSTYIIKRVSWDCLKYFEIEISEMQQKALMYFKTFSFQ